jgi:hypothetical protein
MRKFFFFLILAVGVGIGLFIAVAANGEWGAAAVMMGVGLLFAAPIAAALTGLGRRNGRSSHGWDGGASGGSSSLFKGDSPLRRWDR